jgi:hypothetical protein
MTKKEVKETKTTKSKVAKKQKTYFIASLNKSVQAGSLAEAIEKAKQ